MRQEIEQQLADKDYESALAYYRMAGLLFVGTRKGEKHVQVAAELCDPLRSLDPDGSGSGSPA